MSKAWSGIQSDFRKIEWTKTERTLFCTRTEAKKQISMQVTRMSIERLNAPTNKNCVTMLTVSVCRVLMSCTAFKSTRSINGSIVIKKKRPSMQDRIQEDTPLNSPTNGAQQLGTVVVLVLDFLALPKLCTFLKKSFRLISTRQLG